ncbi:hypothetical protein BST27_14890 [Mycobacterium intermedium]|uniref:Uncharacterized protein n=1 Tax=Mycobacterium intermedium TaxID=28445 RepID=A0A1E3SA61_MYCIE|nr:hypothetical protein [Mycobacterium intermedium]MCV6967545.1 hypothetical protein [Mycobacterium intermedium]ODQ99065.1 hypothetical protein BHQ20_18990 [Mycobacterium intermedium]OPE52794.1 hypothetical protein BV508_00725 [Mycobacterium intermedium]ORB04153.1 hypothetical protein BST27_14890 [Mycobacterium intermedium]
MLPTLSQLRAWDTEHLINAANNWTATADQWEEVFIQIRNQAHSVAWSGAGGDALRDRTTADLSTVDSKVAQLRNAAALAHTGAGEIGTAWRRVIYAVDDAQRAGFEVGEDLSVLDTHQSTTDARHLARQTQAEAFAGDIVLRASHLVGIEQAVSGQLTATAGDVGTISFTSAVAAKRKGNVHQVDWPHDGSHGPPPPFTPWDIPDGTPAPVTGDANRVPHAPLAEVPKPLEDFARYQVYGHSIPNPSAPNVTAAELRLALLQQRIEYDKFVEWFNTTYGGNVSQAELLQRIAAFDAAAIGVAASLPLLPEGAPATAAAAINLLISGYRLAVADPGYAQIPVARQP